MLGVVRGFQFQPVLSRVGVKFSGLRQCLDGT